MASSSRKEEKQGATRQACERRIGGTRKIATQRHSATNSSSTASAASSDPSFTGSASGSILRYTRIAVMSSVTWPPSSFSHRSQAIFVRASTVSPAFPGGPLRGDELPDAVAAHEEDVVLRGYLHLRDLGRR